jgi:predicted nucleic acid-binding protein
MKPGVVDAGVILTRLDRRRRSHRRVVDLLDRCARGDVVLFLSTVNLAEVLQHGRQYSQATGVDLVALISGFGVEIHRPDAEVARVAAEMSATHDLSLADRFAAATARVLKARLHSTDPVLLRALDRDSVPATAY